MGTDISTDIGPPHYKIPNFILCDIHNLPFRNKVFDNVYCNNVLEHIESPTEGISELKRIGSTIHIRQDKMTNLANYATPEHLWFQLPNLKFLRYRRTLIGILISKWLRITIIQFIPSIPHHHQIMRILSFFLPPNRQYEVILN